MEAVATIMTSKVVTATLETSVAEIARLLLENKISAVRVIDIENRVLGIVSQGDLSGRPSADSPRARWLKVFNESAASLEEIAIARHLKARDVMTSPAVRVGFQSPIGVLATLMRRRRVKRVPVLDQGGLVDILQALVGSSAAKPKLTAAARKQSLAAAVPTA